MWLIWVLVVLLLAAGLLAGSVCLVHLLPVAPRLHDLFIAANPYLPVWMSFEQFLSIAVLALLILVGLCAIGMLLMIGVVAAAWAMQTAQRLAVRRAEDQSKAHLRQDYQRLIGLSATLTQRLDKSALLQNILQAAKQITSVPRVESVLGLWALDFETDRLRFARGSRCDETFFTKTDFGPVEMPFAQLATSQKSQAFAKWQDGFGYVRDDKAAYLGEATSLLLVPLIIERTVLGALVIFCHPDLVKQYAQQETFFEAAWGQLTLALGIGVQEELAILDRLTGVVNHTYFVKRLAQEIDRSNRYQLPLAVLMIDVDDFKAVNDQLGHPQGDAVLKIVARLIRREVRATDLVGRYGGEEFIVMLPETGFVDDTSQSSGAEIAAERIRKAIEGEFKHLRKPLAVTVSIGIGVRRQQDRQTDARELIRIADEQLYRAKTAGKNRWCEATSQAPTAPPAHASPAQGAGS